jgi:hypothetical protein
MTEVTITIWCLNAIPGGGLYGAFADSQEQPLVTWFCSNNGFAKWDLGERQKSLYNNLFPQGWKVVCGWDAE